MKHATVKETDLALELTEIPRAGNTKNPKRESLTQQVVTALRRQILEGTVKPGDQLPTEPMLIKAFGVSRTVIREAIAALGADGLVQSRHGVGVFVLEPAAKGDDLDLFKVDNNRMSSVIEALELRAGVEIEAAGLAAQRRSPAQEAKIAEAFEALRSAVQQQQPSAKADLLFHSAIAEATNNVCFQTFLEFVAQQTILSEENMGHGGDAAKELRQTTNFIEEHRQIMTAITEQNSELAREAMRQHLGTSRERISRLNRQRAQNP
ncbi:MAG: FadR/GntR family transcriptional regulator [Burkholderiaceae bacterium]